MDNRGFRVDVGGGTVLARLKHATTPGLYMQADELGDMLAEGVGWIASGKAEAQPRSDRDSRSLAAWRDED
jgi:hypothetical protein